MNLDHQFSFLGTFMDRVSCILTPSFVYTVCCKGPMLFAKLSHQMLLQYTELDDGKGQMLPNGHSLSSENYRAMSGSKQSACENPQMLLGEFIQFEIHHLSFGPFWLSRLPAWHDHICRTSTQTRWYESRFV